MQNDIQKASLWKRIAAGILDMILLVVLATGFGWAISSAVNYTAHSQAYKTIAQQYADAYGIQVTMPEEKFYAMTLQEQKAYEQSVKACNEAMNADEKAVQSYTLVVNLSLVIVTGAVLLSMLVLEFVLPLLIGNGMTVGKKVFALCLVRNDGVKMNTVQFFTRVILGKFAVETMIPVYVAVMMLLGQSNGILLLFALALLIAQIVMVMVTRNHCLLHDLMAGTVVVDYASQKIFKSTEDLIEYQKRIAAERANRQTY